MTNVRLSPIIRLMPDVSQPVPDYELAPVVHADTPARVRAVLEPTRSQILDLVLERAASVTELARALSRPKSSVAHHVDVLLEAGLVRVVRTRKVRAMEERFYGRVGRTVVIADSQRPADSVHASFLSEAYAEASPDDSLLSTLRHVRIPEAQASEFFDQVVALAEQFTQMERSGDTVYGFVAAVYPTNHPVLPDASSADVAR